MVLTTKLPDLEPRITSAGEKKKNPHCAFRNSTIRQLHLIWSRGT